MIRRLAFPALVAALSLILPPAASAQPVDPTDGGRLVSGSSQLQYPQQVAAGSLGGAELSGVPAVDPARYLGKWYQVAAVPQPFSLQCARDTTAEYGPALPGSITVKNSCLTAWGAASGIEGTAEIVDTKSNSSLRVRFPGVPFQASDGPANYRITYLAADYSLAIVGDPARTSGFVLSRTPALTGNQWTTVRATILDRGWWDCAFISTPQSGGLGDATPLCLPGN